MPLIKTILTIVDWLILGPNGLPILLQKLLKAAYVSFMIFKHDDIVVMSCEVLDKQIPSDDPFDIDEMYNELSFADGQDIYQHRDVVDTKNYKQLDHLSKCKCLHISVLAPNTPKSTTVRPTNPLQKNRSRYLHSSRLQRCGTMKDTTLMKPGGVKCIHGRDNLVNGKLDNSNTRGEDDICTDPGNFQLIATMVPCVDMCDVPLSGKHRGTDKMADLVSTNSNDRKQSVEYLPDYSEEPGRLADKTEDILTEDDEVWGNIVKVPSTSESYSDKETSRTSARSRNTTRRLHRSKRRVPSPPELSQDDSSRISSSPRKKLSRHLERQNTTLRGVDKDRPIASSSPKKKRSKTSERDPSNKKGDPPSTSELYTETEKSRWRKSQKKKQSKQEDREKPKTQSLQVPETTLTPGVEASPMSDVIHEMHLSDLIEARKGVKSRDLVQVLFDRGYSDYRFQSNSKSDQMLLYSRMMEWFHTHLNRRHTGDHTGPQQGTVHIW